jgi:hypothetical protein
MKYQRILYLTTVDFLLAAKVYVDYRNPHPDVATVNQLMTDLQTNGKDVTQLLKWPVC